MRPRAWTKGRDDALARAWAKGGAAEAARALGLAPKTCADRARAIGLPDPAAGCVSLSALARALGYSYAKVAHAARALGLELQRCPDRWGGSHAVGRSPRGKAAVTPEQQAQIADLLARAPRLYAEGQGRASEAGRWGVGRKPPACLGHGDADRPHAAGGYCKPCYNELCRAGRRPPPLPRPPRAPAARWADSAPARAPFDGERVAGLPPIEVARRLARPHLRRAAVADAFAEAAALGPAVELLGADRFIFGRRRR